MIKHLKRAIKIINKIFIKIYKYLFKPFMSKNILAKYKAFINDNDFVDVFMSGVSETEESHTQVESYVFPRSPEYITGTLKDYQVQGLNWLVKMHENGINCILADEMGLGKTLQSISLLGYIRFVKNERKKSLVVVPKSVLTNWENECIRFCPGLKTKVFWCSKDFIREEGKDIINKKYDVIITTYEMCISAKKYLKRISFEYLIMDEGHRLKNENSVLTTILRTFKFNHRLLLTGTPLQNNVHELWALLNFILPEVFSDSEKFEEFVKEAGNENSSMKIQKLRNVLQLFFLRREKTDVESSLAPKKYSNIYCPMTQMQREWYKGVLKRDLTDLMVAGKPNKTGLLNILMQLKKVCNHPYLFEGAEEDIETTGEDLVFNCGKMIILDKMLVSLKTKGSRVLLFSQMSRMLDIFEDYIRMRGYKYRRIDGSTDGGLRNTYINDFNKENSDIFIFILTTRAGGLGINLYTADTVILYDSDFNPYQDLQAQDRAHRIGQTKQVHVFRFITEKSIEETIVLRAQQKLKLDDVLLSTEKRKTFTISQKELLQILVSGIDDIDRQEEDADVEKQLSFEDILKIGEEKTREMEQKVTKYRAGAEEATKIDLFKFEGEDYCKRKLNKFVEENRPQFEEYTTKRMGIFKTTDFKPLYFPDYQFFPKEFFKLQEKEETLFYEGKKLSEEEQKHKEVLLSQGFVWTKKDFKTFVTMLKTFGTNKQKIIDSLPEKSDVSEYYDVFMKRYKELEDGEEIMKQVESATLKTKSLKNLKQCS
ncbi:ISW2 [Ecytonucleospora hepatopenaei]|uniref:ISW2 n=1 Tax=Ecytonucleospora hepatopenaei TaxID=646526 RepID=A0A1W0E5Z5_9MICR|nr:ISW2 [Ecytonucleospora hepatopenaei]